jgi:hypothetical protein
MTRNTLVYLGHYQTSFHRLHPMQNRYWKVGDTAPNHEGHEVAHPPEEFEDGVHFGFMQTSDGFVFVEIDPLVLSSPVLFIGGRHGPAGPGPSWSKIDEAATLRILADAIVANPAFRDQLIRLARGSAAAADEQ